MKTYRETVASVLDTIVCDRCGTTAKADELSRQEFVSIDFVGGYDPVFGDGALVKLDLCQHCLRDTLGRWLRVDKGAGAPIVGE